MLGAKLAKFALETTGALAAGIPVTIMNVDENPDYLSFAGMEYKRGTELRKHDPKDLQFFTLSRFMPPELMNFDGRAIVIDPDVFALQDVTGLFELDMKSCSIAACGKKGHYDSSVMLLENGLLKHWKIHDILETLREKKTDYRDLMELRFEKVHEIPRIYNSIDKLTGQTVFLHTSNRITQPWKTGLLIDFTINKPNPLFGFIPRFWVGKPTHYKQHPDPLVVESFYSILKSAIERGAITYADIEVGVKNRDLRPDIRKILSSN